jgi:hypothetical protein
VKSLVTGSQQADIGGHTSVQFNPKKNCADDGRAATRRSGKRSGVTVNTVAIVRPLAEFGLHPFR